MRAVTITRHGPPSVLEVREYPDPTAGPGQLVVDVAAAGLNFAEVTARQGLYPDAPKPPCVVGYEVAGTVAEVGPGVQGWSEGDRVIALVPFGGHASRIALDASLAFALPDSLSFEVGAALPVNYLTAHHALFHVGHARPGDRILVHMAAGGVGTAVHQLLAQVKDVTIFGTASAPKHDYLRAMGCDHPIDYRNQDVKAEVLRLTDEQGVDLVLDPLGGASWKTSWELLRPAGLLVAFGFANAISGPKRNLFRVVKQLLSIPRFSPIGAMNDNRGMVGINMGHLWDRADILRPQMARIVELTEAGTLAPHIHAVLPFDRAAEAHALLGTGQNRGKVILVPEAR